MLILHKLSYRHEPGVNAKHPGYRLTTEEILRPKVRRMTKKREHLRYSNSREAHSQQQKQNLFSTLFRRNAVLCGVRSRENAAVGRVY